MTVTSTTKLFRNTRIHSIMCMVVLVFMYGLLAYYLHSFDLFIYFISFFVFHFFIMIIDNCQCVVN